MKFTLGWLKSHLDTDATLDEIADKLVDLGLEVEEIIDRGAGFEAFVVGHVVEARRHPDADRLKVCLVDNGTERIEVVCGAPNARTGMKGVFAAAGTTIPGTGTVLKKAAIRGVESNGMLCSERELGLGDDHAGIIELPEDAETGAPFAAAAGLDDPVIDIAVTPDRGDCLGVYGIARDLAAAGLGTLRPLDLGAEPGSFLSPVTVTLDFPPQAADACPLFVGRTIRGINNGASPQWMQERLRSVGLRPISALVDITNFLTLDLGRPAHVFDADTLHGGLTIKLGRAGDRFGALNDKEYAVTPEMTVIHDDDGLLSLAGVIGGESSGCTKETTNAFLEIALFDPLRTAATGRTLDIESDARYRFERGVDPAFALPAAEIATRLIIACCGGQASELVIAGAEPEWRREIPFRPARVRELTGLDVEPHDSVAILGRLGFGHDNRDGVEWIAVPPWRPDIDGEADLVEEVARITGYDAIPVVSVTSGRAVPAAALSPSQRRVGWVRRALAARAMDEVVTWSFMAAGQAAAFGGGAAELQLANPISSDLTTMRPSILPNLIDAVRRNADRGFADVALFEVGPQYADDTPRGQSMMASGVRAGRTGPRDWARAPRAVDLFDAKADALAALNEAGAPVANLRTATEAPPWYHPGRSGALKLGPKTVLAWFGEVHPRVLRDLGATGPMAAFELFLDAIPAARRKPSRTRPPLRASDFPAVERDFAFVVAADTPAEALLRAVRGAEKSLITDVALFDVYAGGGIPEGHRSLAVAVTLHADDRTLTDPDIEGASKRIVAAVEKAVGGTLRR